MEYIMFHKEVAKVLILRSCLSSCRKFALDERLLWFYLTKLRIKVQKKKKKTQIISKWLHLLQELAQEYF